MEPWRRLDLAAPDEARAMLHACCGSASWVDRMIERRPFGSQSALLDAAREEWFALSATDWLEAFSHHPRIGEREALRDRFPATHHLSEREQAGVVGASEGILNMLVDANSAYEGKFGFIFIVCATGLSAEQVLGELRRRLENDPLTEVRIAAQEHAKITALRLNAI